MIKQRKFKMSLNMQGKTSFKPLPAARVFYHDLPFKVTDLILFKITPPFPFTFWISCDVDDFGIVFGEIFRKSFPRQMGLDESLRLQRHVA